MKRASLSEILSFQALAAHGALTRVTDLAVRQLDVDYPPITHLALRTDRHSVVLLPWEAVRRIDWSKRLLHVETDEQAEEIDPEKQMVLLRRDILDALILDLILKGEFVAQGLLTVGQRHLLSHYNRTPSGGS